jgi:thiol-disulfide isomerase/thioredoxin
MNGKRVALAVTMVILAGGGVAACSSDDPEPATTAQQPAETGGDATAGNDESPGSQNGSGDGKPSGGDGAGAASGQPGEYVEYSSDLVASTPGEKLLFFHAPWCPQCQELEADIESSELPEGVTIFKVDYDSNQDLRQEYGVTIQTTMVKVDDDGGKVDSYVAYEEPTFASVRSALLD